jgi:hypothetical protein
MLHISNKLTKMLKTIFMYFPNDNCILLIINLFIYNKFTILQLFIIKVKAIFLWKQNNSASKKFMYLLIKLLETPFIGKWVIYWTNYYSPEKLLWLPYLHKSISFFTNALNYYTLLNLLQLMQSVFFWQSQFLK